jgi:AbrB family looped-hinge helix DNA binding protein
MIKHFNFWGTVNVGSKGQIVIPVKARDKFNIKEGDQLIVIGHENKPGLMVIQAEQFENMLQTMQSGISEALGNMSKSNEEK